MIDAMSHEYRHPLDVDLADFAGNLVGQGQRESLEDHLSRCLLCRIKVRRLQEAINGTPGNKPADELVADPSPETAAGLGFAVPGPIKADQPVPGEVWAAGADERLLLLVLRIHEDRVLAAPVTFDTAAADDETIILDASLSPVELPIAVYPMLAAEVPASFLVACFGRVAVGNKLADLLAGSLPGTSTGSPISGPTDPRLEFRQILADKLGALEGISPDPEMASDAPPPRPEHLASMLAAELHQRRGLVCKLHPISAWDGVPLAYSKAWTPVATVDEMGAVLVVFDTPSGLADDTDFDAAVSVLTRYNAIAVSVLASPINANAQLYDSATLHHSIGVPSGQAAAPRPLIAGLSAADAIAKFLDQNSVWTDAVPAGRATTSPTDVAAILARSTDSAIEQVVRQGRQARIKSKVAGYVSIELLTRDLENVLRRALSGELVADRIADLADRGEI